MCQNCGNDGCVATDAEWCKELSRQALREMERHSETARLRYSSQSRQYGEAKVAEREANEQARRAFHEPI